MTKKQKNAVMERKHSVGTFSCFSSIKSQKQGFKEVICEVCDKVFTTNEDVYICPECKKKAKNIY